jgi:hypothetical protein
VAERGIWGGYVETGSRVCTGGMEARSEALPQGTVRVGIGKEGKSPSAKCHESVITLAD